jgi:hypothetical protein
VGRTLVEFGFLEIQPGAKRVPKRAYFQGRQLQLKEEQLHSVPIVVGGYWKLAQGRQERSVKFVYRPRRVCYRKLGVEVALVSDYWLHRVPVRIDYEALGRESDMGMCLPDGTRPVLL